MTKTDPPDEDLLGLHSHDSEKTSAARVLASAHSQPTVGSSAAGKPVAVQVVEMGSALDSGQGNNGAPMRHRKRSPVTRLLRRATLAGRDKAGPQRRRGAQSGEKMYKGRRSCQPPPPERSEPPPQNSPPPPPPQQDRDGWSKLGEVRRRSSDKAKAMRRRISVTSNMVLRRVSNTPMTEDELQVLRQDTVNNHSAAQKRGTKRNSSPDPKPKKAPVPVGDTNSDELQRLRNEARVRKGGMDDIGRQQSKQRQAKSARHALGEESESENGDCDSVDSDNVQSGKHGNRLHKRHDCPTPATAESDDEPRETGDSARHLRSSSLDTSMRHVWEENRSEKDSKVLRRSSMQSSFYKQSQIGESRRKEMFSKAAMEKRRSRRRFGYEESPGDRPKHVPQIESQKCFSPAAQSGDAKKKGMISKSTERQRSRRCSRSAEPLGYHQRLELYENQKNALRRSSLQASISWVQPEDTRNNQYVTKRSNSEGSLYHMAKETRSAETTASRQERMTCNGRIQKNARGSSQDLRPENNLNNLGNSKRRGGKSKKTKTRDDVNKNARPKKSLSDLLDEGRKVNDPAFGTNNDRQQSGRKRQSDNVASNAVSDESRAGSKNSGSKNSRSRTSRSDGSNRTKKKKQRYRVSGFMMCMAFLCYIISIMLFTAFGFWLHMTFLANQHDAMQEAEDASTDAKNYVTGPSEPPLQPSYSNGKLTNETRDDTSKAENERWITKHTPSTFAPSSSKSPTRANTLSPPTLAISTSRSPTMTIVSTLSLPSASPTRTTAPSTLPSMQPSTFPSASPTVEASAPPSASVFPTTSPTAKPSSSPTSSPGCPDQLRKSVVLDTAGLLTMRYEVVVFQGDAQADLGGLLCASLEYVGGAAGWLGLAFSEASRLPEFGRREAIIGIPDILTSTAMSTDSDANIGQQTTVLDDGPEFVNPGKYVIPAGGDNGYYGPSLQWLRDTDEQTLMDASVSKVNGYMDPDDAVLEFMMTKMSFAKYLREPGEIDIDPYTPTLLLFAVATVSSNGKYDGNPKWQSTKLQLLESSSDTVRVGFLRKRKRPHLS